MTDFREGGLFAPHLIAAPKRHIVNRVNPEPIVKLLYIQSKVAKLFITPMFFSSLLKFIATTMTNFQILKLNS